MATYESDAFTQVCQVRQRSTSASPGADVDYSAAVEVLGNWEQGTALAPGPTGGFQRVPAKVFISAGRISGTDTFLDLTEDDLYFPPGVDATDKNNANIPKAFEALPDLDGPSGTIHHYEVTL